MQMGWVENGLELIFVINDPWYVISVEHVLYQLILDY